VNDKALSDSRAASDAELLRPLLRPELAELRAYVPKVPEGIRVRLDANEAPPHTSETLKRLVVDAVAKVALERYPDARGTALRTELARTFGTRPEEILVGSGSDEVIGFIVNGLCRPREGSPHARVLTPSPTFVMYRVTTRAHGLLPVEVPLDKEWDLDVQATKRAIEFMKPNVVFIASPNNPTGTRMSDDRIEAVLAAAPDTFVVVDEAYGDFAGGSLRALRSRYPNLGILRTLSKLGLAALRIGWLEADETLVGELDKARQPFNTSALSQAAAVAVLRDGWQDVEAHVGFVVRERERMAEAIRALPGFEVAPPAANFLWVKTPKPAAELFAGLVERGILVKHFADMGGRMLHQLRITVGTAAENDALLAGLGALVSA
jgi:histidinol-phosphate aminotransferase